MVAKVIWLPDGGKLTVSKLRDKVVINEEQFDHDAAVAKLSNLGVLAQGYRVRGDTAVAFCGTCRLKYYIRLVRCVLCGRTLRERKTPPKSSHIDSFRKPKLLALTRWWRRIL